MPGKNLQLSFYKDEIRLFFFRREHLFSKISHRAMNYLHERSERGGEGALAHPFPSVRKRMGRGRWVLLSLYAFR